MSLSPGIGPDDSTDSSSNQYLLDSSSKIDLQRLTSRHNVISRKDNLILSPQDIPDHNHQQQENKNQNLASSEQTSAAVELLGGKKISAGTFQREFELSDVLDYVKTGVASIIEDEVTQRFEGEELKSWNLLTRTNHKFSFINWKLSCFWCFGFFFRKDFISLASKKGLMESECFFF